MQARLEHTLSACYIVYKMSVKRGYATAMYTCWQQQQAQKKQTKFG